MAPLADDQLVGRDDHVPEVERDNRGKMDQSFTPPAADARPYQSQDGLLPESNETTRRTAMPERFSGGHRTDVSGSAAGVSVVAKIIAEAEVYIKYGLQDKAVEHLEQVFEQDPYNAEVRLKLRDLYVQKGQFPRAARELVVLAQHLVNSDRRMAADLLNEALELDPENGQATALLSAVEGSQVSERVHVSEEEPEAEPELEPEEDAGLEDDTNKVLDLEADIPEAYPVYDELNDGGQETEQAEAWEIEVETPVPVNSPSGLEFTPEYAEEEQGDEGHGNQPEPGKAYRVAASRPRHQPLISLVDPAHGLRRKEVAQGTEIGSTGELLRHIQDDGRVKLVKEVDIDQAPWQVADHRHDGKAAGGCYVNGVENRGRALG